MKRTPSSSVFPRTLSPVSRVSVALVWATLSLLGLMPATVQPVLAQSVTYRTVSKRCGNCGHAVSLRSRAGGRCPYCGAFWATEHSTFHRHSRHVRKVAKSRHVRKRSRHAARGMRFYPAITYRLPEPIQRVELPQPVLAEPVRPIEAYRPVAIDPPQVAQAPAFESTAGAVDRIRSQPFSPLPAPTELPASGSQQGGMNIQNQTQYTLTLHFVGPVNKTVSLFAGVSTDISLPPGTYEVAGEVSNRNVRPFYGRQTYNADTRYQESFYIVTR